MHRTECWAETQHPGTRACSCIAAGDVCHTLEDLKEKVSQRHDSLQFSYVETRLWILIYLPIHQARSIHYLFQLPEECVCLQPNREKVKEDFLMSLLTLKRNLPSLHCVYSSTRVELGARVFFSRRQGVTEHWYFDIRVILVCCGWPLSVMVFCRVSKNRNGRTSDPFLLTSFTSHQNFLEHFQKLAAPHEWMDEGTSCMLLSSPMMHPPVPLPSLSLHVVLLYPAIHQQKGSPYTSLVLFQVSSC